MDRLLEHIALIGFLNPLEADVIRESNNQLLVVFALYSTTIHFLLADYVLEDVDITVTSMQQLI